MATGTTVTVYADGVRLADGHPTDDPLDPTVLDGLTVNWGRATTVDQPEPSTMTMDLMDTPGGQAFADRLHVGTPLAVTATGTTYPDPTVTVWPDPGFEAGANGSPISATLARVTTQHHSGVASARIKAQPSPAGRFPDAYGANVVPAPFSAPNTNPGAWDAIPTTSPGQVWQFGAWVRAPLGAHVQVRPILYTGPYAGAYDLAGPVLHSDGTGAWQLVSGHVTVQEAGRWVGVRVITYPVGQTWDQVVGTWDAQTMTWDDLRSVYVDDVQVLAPAAGTPATVLVWAGRVTDLAASYDDTIPGPVLRVTGADFTADLANVYVGDQPWTAEALSVRFQRILDLSGLGITAQVDAKPGAYVVSWRDVDRSAAAGLLTELAESADAVLWSAVHQVTGPYLRVEDTTRRGSGRVLALVGGVVVLQDDPLTGRLAISACDVLRDPVTFTQDVGDISTRTDVTWLEQGVGETFEHTVTQVSSDREDPRQGNYGTRRYGLSTQLTLEADARAVGAAILARTGAGWRLDGVNLSDDTSSDVTVSMLLALLDGTSRNGLAAVLVDLPAWAPDDVMPVYVEGGAYAFTEGAWSLDLLVSSATAQGAGVAWDAVPVAWTWDQFDPSITWDALTGTGV